MLRKLTCAFALCALAVMPVLAQEKTEDETKTGDASAEATENADESASPAVNHGWGLRAGYLLGDTAAKSFSGEPRAILGISKDPEFKDAPVLGGFYYYEFSPKFKAEARLSIAAGKVGPVCPDAKVDPVLGILSSQCRQNEKSVRTTLVLLEVAFMPRFSLGSTDIAIPFGFGWSGNKASEKYAPPGWVAGLNKTVEMEGASGMTYFVGVQPSWKIGKGRRFFVEARAVRIHKVVNVNERTLKSFEATAGVSFPFGG